MEEKKFFQLFLYSLVNLVSFLLSVIFLTSLYNVRSQTKLIGIDKRLERDYHESEKSKKTKCKQYCYTYITIPIRSKFFKVFGIKIILFIK